MSVPLNELIRQHTRRKARVAQRIRRFGALTVLNQMTRSGSQDEAYRRLADVLIRKESVAERAALEEQGDRMTVNPYDHV